MKKRIEWIDLLKGFGIILVVLGHCITYIEDRAVEWDYVWKYIASFNMPLFFMISGYLYHTKKDKGNEFLRFIGAKAKSLLLPFIGLTVLFVPLGYVRAVMTGGAYDIYNDFLYLISLSWKGSTLNGVTWFLVALFWMNLIHYVLTRLSVGGGQKCRWLEASVAIILVVISFIPFVSYIPFARWRAVLSQYIFFYLGYELKRDAILEDNRFFNSKILGTAAIILGGVISFANDTVITSSGYIGNAALFYLSSVSSCIGWFVISKSSEKLANNFLLKWLKMLGKDSLLVMCLHIPAMYVVRIALNSYETPLSVFMGLIVIMTIIVYLKRTSINIIEKRKVRLE